MPAREHIVLLPTLERVEAAERLVRFRCGTLVAHGGLEGSDRALRQPLVPQRLSACEVFACRALCAEAGRAQTNGGDQNDGMFPHNPLSLKRIRVLGL
jgi:hypothetical protein